MHAHSPPERTAVAAPLTLPERPSIAVLPFANMSGDVEQEYFADGICEDILTALSRLRWLFVIARNSSFVYKGRAVDVTAVARELGVRYVLEGSVRKSATRLRVTAQLIDGESGGHLWAERYDRELADIFDVQDEITTSVVGAIAPQVLVAEGMRALKRPNSLAAWDMLMRALARCRRMTRADTLAALDLLEATIASHPEFAHAWSMLAITCLRAWNMGWAPPAPMRSRALEAARKAALLDAEDAWAQLSLAIIASAHNQPEEAGAAFRSALTLDPNFAAAEGFFGYALVMAGRRAEGLAHIQRALRLSPHDPDNAIFLAVLGLERYLAGEYLEALQWTRQAVRLAPEYTAGLRIHCAALAQGGALDEARAALARIRELQPDLTAATLAQYTAYTRPADFEHVLAGLRKAGLD
jgi:TolB-like protein/Flp pilus assembly protein TadD